LAKPLYEATKGGELGTYDIRRGAKMAFKKN
jgi:hypothetical protein